MGLTSSLFSGLSGMKTNEFAMDVIGHNIANVNTHGFKSSRATFQSQFYNTFSFGSAPEGAIGGTNPMQIGTGTGVGAVTRNFAGGAPEATGLKTDLAIEGQGLFVVAKPDGSEAYTRDGAFQFNAENYLVTADGYFLQGYGVDSSFGILEGTLTDLRVPIGEITTATATTSAVFSGDLDAEGYSGNEQVALGNSVRPILWSQHFTDGGGADATSATLLTELDNGTGTVAVAGNVITLEAAAKGGQTLPEETFTVTATSTLGDFVAWLEDVLGINTRTHTTGLPDYTADGVPDPGVLINPTDDPNPGYVRIVGNMGDLNDLEMGSTAIRVTQGTAASVGTGGSQPFTFEALSSFERAAVGSVRTSFTAYDSLGVPLEVELTLVMEDKSDTGITWRYFAESTDDSDADRVLSSGTFSFDITGQYTAGNDLVISLDRAETGAASPQSITLDFSNMDGYAMNSIMSLLSQDGFMAGTLQDFSVGSDGIVVGSFDNGLTRQLGQVVLATFRNYEGLIGQSDNLYVSGPNSGSAIIKQPYDLGAGTIASASLELSNVDLSREFINLIINSTGFSASSKVIQTCNDLLDNLIMMTR